MTDVDLVLEHKLAKVDLSLTSCTIVAAFGSHVS